ncbi:MAG TPA: M56 family metallopeptidase [Ferruginibacter sp.]|nr:M56 family metallopeptidase [Ferruginibacter sp.]
MLPFFWYMLKVMISSGILLGYYWLFLRNKIFHQYNRFYLLAALSLSLLLPLLKIDFWQQDTQSGQVIRVLQAVSAGDEYMSNIVVTAQSSNWSMQDIYSIIYWSVSIIFFIIMLRTLFLIWTLLKRHPVQLIDEVSFVNTNNSSTPFSFLKFIFWNSNIDIDTNTGRQIFRHEVAHIQEKHTYDKLLINTILVFGWCNPFFWLYRKELNMIHEFIADKKAVSNSDTADFAAMILQAAYPHHQFQLTNNFFYSPIRRRLFMLTKNKNPRVNYFARIMALPLAILIFAAFSLKARSNDAGMDGDIHTTFSLAPGLTVKPGTSTVALIDSLFETVGPVRNTTDTLPDRSLNSTISNSQKPVCILDGCEVDSTVLNKLNPNDISTIDVVKDEAAVTRYGAKAKNGVILIKTKKYKETVEKEEAVDPEKALIVYNGTIIGKEGKRLDGQFSQLMAMTLSEKRLKKPEAIAKYGADGIHGAIEYTTTDAINITTAYVDADKKPVFYIGMNNMLTVNAQNTDPEDLVVDISGGKITGANGNYIVQVTHAGEVDLTFSKRDGTKLPGTFTIKTKIVPDPLLLDISAGEEEKILYDSLHMVKLKYQLLASQQNLAKLDYSSKELLLQKTLNDSKVKIVEGRKLQELNLTKEKQQLLLKQQLELAKTDYAEREVLVKAARANSELSVAGKKLQEREIEKLKQQNLFQKNANANQQYAEGRLLSQDKAAEYQKQLAEIEVQGRPGNLVFSKVEVNPQFAGGENAWRTYLVKNLKSSIAVEEGWKAGKYTVIVSFIVHADGTISNVVTENYKGTKTAKHCIEIIENGPKWLPAIQNGKKVNAFKKQPITFVIEEK